MATFNNAVMSLSGGVDSTTMLALYLSRGMSVVPVFFKYPSQHNPHEMQAAIEVAKHYKQSLRIVDVTSAFQFTSSGLISGEISDGPYTSEGMQTTVVPGRNLIFAAILASIAQSVGGCYLGLGVHAGDHELYADCREEWVVATSYVIDIQSEYSVRLDTPFSSMTKREIVMWGRDLNVPYHLTRSCYSADGTPCHKCATCIERDDAFVVNGYTIDGVLR